ncbi:PAS domain S-box protein [Maridesulfovibrio zosterae]|uniref:PAS domain S-box protein n=1 Tax=Maridesulfovibrio zosterae TaxID=82171 RepID=UPI001FDF5C65|nr:PAS domain S-box protein [Maridesulfovibrio zosterae]
MIFIAVTIFIAVYKISNKNDEIETTRAMLCEAQSISGLGNWNLDICTGIVWWSSEIYKIFGVDEEYIASQKSFLKRVHPDDRRKVRDLYTRAMENKENYIFDHRVIRPSGEVRYVSVKGGFEYDKYGETVRAYGVVLDITKRKMFENGLRESNERFDHISDRLSDRFFFFSHTISGEFINLSKGVELLGYGAAEKFIGSKCVDLVPWTSDSLEKAAKNKDEIISGKKDTAEYELSYIHSDGTEHFLTIISYTTFNFERNESVFEGIAIDVTARKSGEEKLKVLTRAIENAPVSVVVTDITGAITYVNPYFSVETGYSREEALGQNPRILKSGKHDDEFYKGMWETVSRGETWRSELLNKKKDGSLYWESASISPVYNKGEIVSYVAVKEDINDRKDLECLKNDIDLIMRHDLKTPLNGIIGLPGLLLMDDNLTDEQRHLIKVIEDSGHNMLHMIDLSLDMFKMEKGEYEYSPIKVDILGVARQVIEQSCSKSSTCKVGIETFLNNNKTDENSKMFVYGEERLVYSLMSGLIINAIEASSAGEVVRIEFFSIGISAINICNKGVVPQQIRDNFFQKFVTEGKRLGTGIGTYSAKLMADTMHYDLTMKTSDSANETCIRIIIPSEMQKQDKLLSVNGQS